MKKSSFWSIFLAFVIFGGSFLLGSSAFAATTTVCGSGCDYTSLQSALLSSASPGDVVAVGATYTSTTESFPLEVHSGVTLDCQNSGAVIGNTDLTGNDRVYVFENATIRNCSFGNTLIYASGYNPDGITIQNNIFSRSTTGTIQFDSGMDNFTIKDNQNIGGFYPMNTPTSTDTGLIEGNTFYFHNNDAPAYFVLPDVASNVVIRDNTFESASNSMFISSLLRVYGTDNEFVSNTIRYVSNPSVILAYSVDVRATSTLNFSGNMIEAPNQASSCMGAFISASNNQAVTWNINHNTFKLSGECTNGSALTLADMNNGFLDITANLSYNLFSTSNGGAGATGIRVDWQSPAHTFAVTNDYSGFYGLNRNIWDRYDHGGVGLGAYVFTGNPFFRTSNLSSADDFDLAPFSPFLDVNGTQDIGAVPGARRSTINVDASGIVDYSSVDATTTVSIGDVLRSGDTLNLASGVYAPISVSSTQATTTLSIVGTEDGVIIDGNLSPSEDGMLLRRVASSTIENLTIRNASSTLPSSYTVDLMNASFGGHAYDEEAGMVGSPASSTIIFLPSDGPPPYFTSNDYDITDVLSGHPLTDWHLVLANLGGNRTTILLPGFVANSAAEFEMGVGVAPDAFATSTFISNGDGTFTFNQSALDEAEISLLPWVTPTPEIARVLGARLSGIRLDQSRGISITNVTSTANGNGISFGAGSVQNTIEDTLMSTNSSYDVNDESDERNIFDNVSFTTSSAHFSGMGDLQVRYKTRVLLTRASMTAISGGTATATAADLTETLLGTTDAFGYTSYTSLPAYILSATNTLVTSGGYNPYTFDASAASYLSSSTSNILSSPNQTVTLVMRSSAPPIAPTDAVTSSVGIGTATLAWTDNSDDETSFVVEYRAPRTNESYPGTTTSVTSGDSVAISGLTPGESYEFRVAAVNSNGTSTYATSSVFAVSAAVPSSPALTALSSTSLSVELGSNGNATSVTYAIYSSTLGGYLDASSTVTSTAVWQTTSTWGVPTVSDLACHTSYAFVAIARNTALVASVTSSVATMTTNACATSGGGGGGGGGGSMGGGGGISGIGFILPGTLMPSSSTTLPSVPVSTSSSPVVPAVPSSTSVAPEAPAALPETSLLDSRERLLRVLGVSQNTDAENRSVSFVRQDAREFSVSLSDAQANRLALFIAYGASPETRRLGEGERRALIRDMLETMQRADLSADDMQRLTTGQIPLMRNIAVERQQLPRVRQTFRTLFGHDPNFQNPQENLAWNTLMYRIRFSRNLSLEQQGIQEFRSVFRRSPTTPFQWAAVRVQGYVQR